MIIGIFGIVLFITATLNFKPCLSMCARAEYEINGECCPMCAPGNRVYWHCTVDTSTTCVPCSASTYTDEPNGLDKCHPCSVCDAGQGLRVKRSCTRSADTVCEPLEGFHCKEQNKGSCRFAVKHSECHPGQYIRQAGTAFTDTDCGNCAEGTYSNGSFSTCQPHSTCETEIKPGTMSSDAECGNSSLVAIIVGVILVVITGGLVTAFGIRLKHKRHNTNRNTTYSQTPTTESTLGMAGERPPPEGACQSDSEAIVENKSLHLMVPVDHLINAEHINTQRYAELGSGSNCQQKDFSKQSDNMFYLTLPDSGHSVLTRNNRIQTKDLSIGYHAKNSEMESETERQDKEVLFSATSHSALNTKVNMQKTL